MALLKKEDVVSCLGRAAQGEMSLPLTDSSTHRGILSPRDGKRIGHVTEVTLVIREHSLGGRVD
jgi:hypothetical protein